MSSEGSSTSPRSGTDDKDTESQVLQFDDVNLGLGNSSSPNVIELMVTVPLANNDFANIKVSLHAPVRATRDGKDDYKMDVDTDLQVTKSSATLAGPARLFSIDGLSWEVPLDYTGGGTIVLSHEPKVKAFLTKRFLPGRVFVDVGANLGAYSVRAAAWEVKVHSFEPNPENVKGLKRNLEINELSAEIVECALGASEGVVALSPNGAISRIGENGRVKVPVRTLDSFELQQVDVLKIDVEGYELQVLQGALKTLERCHPAMIVEVHHWIGAEKEAALFNILLGLGYHFEYLDRGNLGRHLAATYNPTV